MGGELLLPGYIVAVAISSGALSLLRPTSLAAMAKVASA